jgi:hypothetical protein
MIPVSPQSYDTRFPCHQRRRGVVGVQWARRHEESRRGRGVVAWNAYTRSQTDQKISILEKSVELFFDPFRMVRSDISTLRNEMNRFRIFRVSDEDDARRRYIELS